MDFIKFMFFFEWDCLGGIGTPLVCWFIIIIGIILPFWVVL